MMTQIHMQLIAMLSLLACPINKACDVQLMRPGLRCEDGNSNGNSNGDGTLLPLGTIDDEVTSNTDAPPPGTMITSKNGTSNIAATMMTGMNVMYMFTDLPQGNGNGQGGGSNGNNDGSLNGYNGWNGRAQINRFIRSMKPPLQVGRRDPASKKSYGCNRQPKRDSCSPTN